MLVRPLESTPCFKMRPITDVDVALIQERLQHLGLTRLNKDTTHQAVDVRAQERSFHPIRNYLTALAWDGTPRLKDWLVVNLGAERTVYNEKIGVMFLVAMVAR